MKEICLDPGHPSFFKDGKINWGAVSKDGTREVELNLIISNFLQKELEALGYKVVTSRKNNDEVIDNIRRIKIAQENKADFIFRIHCDQAKDGDDKVNGLRVFYPPKAADKIYEKSFKAAEIIYEKVIEVTKLKPAGLVDDTQANIDPQIGMLVGTREANKYGTPTVLIEMVYLSNPENSKWITNPENQRTMSRALAEGIDLVFKKGIL